MKRGKTFFLRLMTDTGGLARNWLNGRQQSYRKRTIMYQKVSAWKFHRIVVLSGEEPKVRGSHNTLMRTKKASSWKEDMV